MIPGLGKSVAIQPSKVQIKKKYLPSLVGDWTTYYSISFLCTSASKLRILHRIISTNVVLMKMGVKDLDKFFLCD